jgi:hypothetical protein
MKTKQFRVQLLPGSNEVANQAAIYACEANGDSLKMELGILGVKAFSKLMAMGLQDTVTQCELIGENTLHIDTKINGSYETVCIIEEIEVFELMKPASYNLESVN